MALSVENSGIAIVPGSAVLKGETNMEPTLRVKVLWGVYQGGKALQPGQIVTLARS